MANPVSRTFCRRLPSPMVPISQEIRHQETAPHVMRVAVVGAGVSGLTAVKSCVEAELDVVCFESSGNIGGLWKKPALREKGETVVYENLLTNTSKEKMALSDYPMPAEWPTYPTAEQVYKYLENYAEEFSLLPFIKFHCSVNSVCQSAKFQSTGQWLLEVHNSEDDVTHSLTFDAVMICTGVNRSPVVPDIPNMHLYEGEIMHSQTYENAERFKDKQVVVIGSSSSGCDIATEVADNTDKPVYMVSRSGCWVFRRDYAAPIDMKLSLFISWLMEFFPDRRDYYIISTLMSSFDYKKYGFCPQGLDFDQHAIAINDKIHQYIELGRVAVTPNIQEFTNRGVKLTDGRYIDADAVILATGFHVKVPCLEERCFDQSRWPVYEMVWPMPMSKQTLALIGLVKARGAVLPVAEMQSRWAALVFKGEVKLPSRDQMCKDTTTYCRERHGKLQSYVTVSPTWYPVRLSSYIGCFPSLGLWSFFSAPSLWLRVVFGPFVSYIFRLSGPGRWSSAKRAIKAVWSRIRPTHPS